MPRRPIASLQAVPPARGRSRRPCFDGLGSSEFSAARHDKSTIIYSKSTNELRAFLGGIDYDQTRMDNELHTLLPVPYPAGGIGWHDVGVELRGGELRPCSGISAPVGRRPRRYHQRGTSEISTATSRSSIRRSSQPSLCSGPTKSGRFRVWSASRSQLWQSPFACSLG